MSYLTRLDELRRAELFKRASEFAVIYKPELPTIVILPGGMGSRLQRCTEPYDPATSPPIARFYELWAGLGPILKGELKYLAQKPNTEESDLHAIIAAGELTNVVKSYNGIFEHFAGKANVIGLGYDWRRAPIKECGYVRVFLRLIAEQVKARHPTAPDPRRRLTLYAHSQGGLVGKLFVNELVNAGENPADWFERFVTCCTPFYGTNSHFARYYIGEPVLNRFTGGADAVARIVATFQGTYILLPAPRSVLAPRLAAFGLARYPVRDMDDARIECDPFDAAPLVAGRYRPEVSRAHLAFARDQFVQIDRDFPAALSQRVYHIRSDIYANGTNRNLEMQWKAVNGPGYSASLGNPIGDNSALGGRGDSTVPLWSASLPGTPDANVFDMQGVRHGGAAEHPCALHILSSLLEGRAVLPCPQTAEPDFDYASKARVSEIAAELHAAPPSQARARLDALPAGEYRAFVDSLSLCA